MLVPAGMDPASMASGAYQPAPTSHVPPEGGAGEGDDEEGDKSSSESSDECDSESESL